MPKIIFWKPPPPGGILVVNPAITTAAAASVRRQMIPAVFRYSCRAPLCPSLPPLVHSPQAPSWPHSSVVFQTFPSRPSISSTGGRLISLVRALSSSSAPKTGGDEASSSEGGEKSLAAPSDPSDGDGALEMAPGRPHGANGDYPTGEFEMERFDWWKTFTVKLRLLFALPWERVKKGSVLHLVLRGGISDQLQSRFSSGLSLPEICQSFIKAAYDPRISGVYLQIEPLSCGWGKIDEIRRHILNFKKSGKFIVSYMPICGEKEYYLACACEEIYAPPSAYVALYGLTVQSSFLGGPEWSYEKSYSLKNLSAPSVSEFGALQHCYDVIVMHGYFPGLLEKAGVEPQIQRIGRYKSAGDQLSCKSMTKEVREMLTTLLDNIYENWLETISSVQGKTKDRIEDFLNSGVYQVEKLKEEGWITNMLYDDEVRTMLKKRLGQEDKEKLRVVDYKKYTRVRNWTLGLHGGEDQIAVIRASGSISRSRGPLSSPNSSIIAEQLIEKIRTVREAKKYKAVILRIDSPGGDALASDLMWREIRLLAASTPVIASMSDVAASGGYYMAMAADVIVAEKLTLTGSIGVVTGKFSLQNLYERIGFNKEIISRGKYAELVAAEQRPFRPEEAELFAESAQNAYRKFRDKAAFSRSMTVDQMEEVAQGRVWSGKDGFSRGLVDAIGGFSRAIAIAKSKANLPQEKQVRLVEISRPSPSFAEVLTGIGSYVFDLDNTVKDLLQEVTSSSGVQARMDGILFEQAGNTSDDNPIFILIKDYLNSY